MSMLFLIILIVGGCASDEPPDDEFALIDGGVDAGSDCNAGEEGCPCTGDIGMCAAPGVEEPAGPPFTDEEFAEMTEAEVHELWFGDSDWMCCWSSTCRNICDEPDEVPTQNGHGTTFFCAPNIGQCVTQPATD